MGIHICVMKGWGKDHPDWDGLRYAGDSDFPNWTDGLPADFGGLDGEGFRPLEFERWYAALPADRPNPDRFPHMLRLLEADPGYWVYYSR